MSSLIPVFVVRELHWVAKLFVIGSSVTFDAKKSGFEFRGPDRRPCGGSSHHQANRAVANAYGDRRPRTCVILAGIIKRLHQDDDVMGAIIADVRVIELNPQ